MPTVEIARIHNDLSNRPTIDRHIEYVIRRIEDELVKRAKAQALRFGIRL